MHKTHIQLIWRFWLMNFDPNPARPPHNNKKGKMTSAMNFYHVDEPLSLFLKQKNTLGQTCAYRCRFIVIVAQSYRSYIYFEGEM